MAKVTMFWHGGSSYACFDVHSARDAEVFDSLADARRAFERRADFDPHYPCVESPEAWIFYGDSHPVIGEEYPDRIIRLGKRGGVIVERA